MTENTTSDRFQKLNQLWYESSEMVVKSIFEMQDRSVQYAQKSFADGVETLKGNLNASQSAMQMDGNPMDRNPMDQQEGMQARMESGAEAYKRNIDFLQRLTEQGSETFRANIGSMRDLALTLMKKAQERQDIFF